MRSCVEQKDEIGKLHFQVEAPPSSPNAHPKHSYVRIEFRSRLLAFLTLYFKTYVPSLIKAFPPRSESQTWMYDGKYHP